MNKVTKRVEDVAALIVQGVACWFDAGKLLCELLDEDPSLRDRIQEIVPELTPPTVRHLERIGRGQLLPELVLRMGPGWSRLRMMPVEVQRTYLDAPVEVLFPDKDGPKSLKVSVADMSPDTAKQVFAPDGTVRHLGEQRAYLEQVNAKRNPMPELAGPKWVVRKHEVIIREACRLTSSDIGEIVKELAN